MIEPNPTIDPVALERVIHHVGETLVESDIPREQRMRVWHLLRSLIAMRSAEQVAQLERDRGLVSRAASHGSAG